MIKSLIFDFGLVISEARPVELFHSYERDLGLKPDTINTIMFDSAVWQLALIGKISMQQFWQAIGPALNLSSEEEIASFQSRYYQDERINDRVISLIQQLYGEYKLAVLSNHPAGLDRWLEDWQIANFFDVVYCSGEEGKVKPQPTVYYETLRRMEVTPAEAIFIDDTAGHVSMAERLGIRGVVFHNGRQCAEEVHRILKSIE